MDLLLKELSSTPKESENSLAKLIVLKETAQRHVDQEEHELFPMAKEQMDEKQANDLAKKFLDQKKRLH